MLHSRCIPLVSFFAVLASSQTTDPNYRALRDAVPAESVVAERIVLQRDAATIELRSGTISFLPPVMGKVTGAVFAGEGTFTLKPGNPLEQRHVKFRTSEETISDRFQEMVLYFTDGTYEELKKLAGRSGAAGPAAQVLTKWRKTLRRNPETFRSSTEAMLSGEDQDNVEAEILGELYNPSKIGLFSAYFEGEKFKHLRYHIRPRGALPFLPSTEEVALLSIDDGGTRDGILYLAGLGASVTGAGPTAVIDVSNYAIDTTVGKNRKLSATAALTFTAVAQGARVVKFGLLPTLRVSKVALDGVDVPFIQEDKEQDGSFYVVMPDGLKKGQTYKLTIAYAGDKVIYGEGGGNFAVGARTSWYPSVNAFSDYATFELKFRSPKDLSLVSIGKLLTTTKEGDDIVTHWTSSVPVAVAGFNYGRFKAKEISDQRTGYTIEGHAASEVPDYLRSPGGEGPRMSPTAMMAQVMSEAQASVQLFTHFFGPAPYGRIAVTQQPEFNFGQSWPTLVYLPVSAFLDSTQRWMLMGSSAFQFKDFIQEVTSHEVAHQWWGHIVGWSSYRDQWLSEGFADFSASLFIQATRKGDNEYRAYLKRWTDEILKKNQFGLTANDAGPIAAGHRLNSHRTPGAYGRIAYAKGGCVVHMIRSMMYDAQGGGDKPFIEMMRDFVKTYAGNSASTADFQRIVEKHMQPHMNMEGDGTMSWFFRQWVYGTEIPKYKMTYSLTPQSGGGCELRARVTQSGVSDGFKMPVRLYVSHDNKILPLGRVGIAGSSTSQEIVVKLPLQPKEILLNYNSDVLSAESVVERSK